MKYHHNIKCDCGHRQLSHNNKEQCKLCGCTWFHPNINYKWKPKTKDVIKREGHEDINVEHTPEKLILKRDTDREVLMPIKIVIENLQQDIIQLQEIIKTKQSQLKILKKA